MDEHRVSNNSRWSKPHDYHMATIEFIAMKWIDTATNMEWPVTFQVYVGVLAVANRA